MTGLRSAEEVRAWLDQNRIDQVIVMSPHLDDAALSVAGFLKAAPHRSEVITFFTEGQAGQATDWARLAGFQDSAEEHAARRLENARAMQHIGCRFRHLGLRPGELSETLAAEVVQGLSHAQASGLARSLVLLPAGAGGPQPGSAWQRLIKRLLRRPSGTLPHGEHEQTRDRLWQALAGTPARIGFYAELPYVWAQTNTQLQQHLLNTLGCQTERLELQVDAEEKRAIFALYSSQLPLILGTHAAYQRRVLARNECLCLVPAGATETKATTAATAA